MKLLTLDCPISGAIHFRGIVGTIGVIGESGGAPRRYILDPKATQPANAAIVQHAAGELLMEPSPFAYHQLQVFATHNFAIAYSVVSVGSVTNQKGKKIREPDASERATIRFEISATTVLPGPNIWVAWMVAKVGKIQMRVLGDGKEIARRAFTAEPFPETLLSELTSFSDLQFANHISPRVEKVSVGEVVSIPFSLKDVEAISTLKLVV